jgi:Uma2 family endonuclease
MEEIKLSQPANLFLGLTEAQQREFGLSKPPTQDELPYSDGMPMESNRHVLQMYLLIETLKRHWANREDVFVGGNMFVYFSSNQSLNHDFRGPDFFAVQGVPYRVRKSWVVWEEGKGPDVVIELLSDSTADRDKEEKKLIYQERLRVPEYFYFHPYTGEWAGFSLHDGVYEPIPVTADGQLPSQQTGLGLVQWRGVFKQEFASWLRWVTPDGELVPTDEEASWQAQQEAAAAQQEAAAAQQEAAAAQQEAAAAQQEAAAAQQEAAAAQQEAAAAQQKVAAAHEQAKVLEEELARYRARFGELPE